MCVLAAAGYILQEAKENMDPILAQAAELRCTAEFLQNADKEVLFLQETTDPLYDLFQYSIDEKTQSVTVTVYDGWLGERTASNREHLGCAVALFKPVSVVQAQDATPPQTVALATPRYQTADWICGPKTLIANCLEREIDVSLSNDLSSYAEKMPNFRSLMIWQDGKIITELYGEGVSSKSRLQGQQLGEVLTFAMLGSAWTHQVFALEPYLFKNWLVRKARGLGSKSDLLTLMSMNLGYDPEQPWFNRTVERSHALLSPEKSILYTSNNVFKEAVQEIPASWRGSLHLANPAYAILAQGYLKQKISNKWPEVTPKQYLDTYLLDLMDANSFILQTDEYLNIIPARTLATTQDWLKLGLLIHKGGQALSGEQIIRSDWVQLAYSQDSHSSASTITHFMHTNKINSVNKKRSFSGLPLGSVLSIGDGGQILLSVPDYNLVLVYMGWDTAEKQEDLVVFSLLQDLFARRMLIRNPNPESQEEPEVESASGTTEEQDARDEFTPDVDSAI